MVLVALGGGLLAAVAANCFVAFRLTRSLRQLSAATGRVADGSFRKAAGCDSSDEVGDLTLAFNHMAEELREVGRAQAAVLLPDLARAPQPLTAIRASAQLLLRRPANLLDAKGRHWVQSIDSSVDRLLSLVTRILDLNRLRAGVFPLELHLHRAGQGGGPRHRRAGGPGRAAGRHSWSRRRRARILPSPPTRTG
jgi:signal transduction histidine kinase